MHVNGFKISERTIYGTMDDKELVALFAGYGYQVRFVEDLPHIDEDMAASLQWALGEIHKIQDAARNGRPIVKPRWPVLILRTPKGWSGPKEIHGEFIEGSFHAHQVPLPKAKTDKEELQALQAWLESYKPKELFDAEGRPNKKILSIIPEVSRLIPPHLCILKYTTEAGKEARTEERSICRVHTPGCPCLEALRC